MRIIILLMILGMAVWACTPGEGPSGNAGTPSASRLKKDIKALEKKLAAQPAGQLDTVAARQLVAQTEVLFANYPTDEATGALLFRAADVARSTGDFEKAIVLWGQVNRQYPNYERAAEAIFLQGFSADQDLRDLGRAKRFYRYFIQKYPEHELVKDANLLLSYIESDKSPEDLIKLFENQNVTE